MKVIVTGGAGFIGSHLVDALLKRGDEVIVFDNLRTGTLENLREAIQNRKLKLVKGDLKQPAETQLLPDDASFVFHLAANPEVRVGQVDPSVHFNENLLATFNLLEKMRRSRVSTIVFASTSTVYGEASTLPTPEDYGPMLPISSYGASKLGCEALISSYAYTHNMCGLILRLGNCVGRRSGHGVIHDFIQKLQINPKELEILGDGSQNKSYVHIDDCIAAILVTSEQCVARQNRMDVYNLSSPDQVSVKRIAEIVAEEMQLPNAKLRFTGGVDGGRGWFGDVKLMHLSVDKLLKLGWQPKLNSEQAIRTAARELIADSRK